MDNLIKRHANLSLLVVVLFAQLLGLAVQVKVETDEGTTRLIRRWTVAVFSPLQKAFVHGHGGVRNTWNGYFWLRGVRQENEELKAQLDQMRLEQVRLKEDAEQGKRLQYLLAFKEQYISKTVAAQVIGSSGSEHSKVVYIDKGSNDGLHTDMAVITPQGVVGKTIEVDNSVSKVLLINDQSSGIGAILTKRRLQGILKGAPGGVTMLNYIMADENIEPGEEIVTSGGDRIFPKGLPVGKVSSVTPARDMFLTIRVSPAANLSQVEEVLVITEVKERAPDVDLSKGPIRAADILAERLPSVPPKPPEGQAATGTTPTPTAQGGTPQGAAPNAQAPAATSGSTVPKASTTTAVPKASTATAVPKASGATAVPKASTTPVVTNAPSTAAPKKFSDLNGASTNRSAAPASGTAAPAATQQPKVSVPRTNGVANSAPTPKPADQSTTTPERP
jgi:rod shape-determining protein MreC